MGVTNEVSEFAIGTKLLDVPAEVRRLAKRSILDGLGLAIAGARARSSVIIRNYITDQDCAEQATVLGTSLLSSARFAALANGVAIHADDYDDTQLAVSPDRVYGLLTHPTAPVLPCVLALAERERRSGADLLLAYLVGVEVATKAAEAINPRHYQDGFHSTGTLGAIGAAAGAASILRLDLTKTEVCIGIAASQAGGLRENFGTMTKPFHAGRAAESGVVAADLALRGLTAARNALEAPRGLFRAAGGGYRPELIEGKFGLPWTFETPGISIKPHPCGSLTHPAMGALAEIIAERNLSAIDVASLRVGTSSQMPNALIHHRPTDALQAKFSMEFCMAILLLDRRAGLAEFTDDVVRREDVKELIGRITFEADDAAEAAGLNTMRSIVDVHLRDGTVVSKQKDFGKGSPEQPMSDHELLAKFIDCARWAGLPEKAALDIADLVLELEGLDDVAQLVGLMVTRPHG